MEIRENLIVTTSWDDGVTHDLKLAEMLDKYKLKGTFYISRVAAHNLLQESEIATLDKRFEISAHTMNHPDLTGISLQQADMEIKNSKGYLEDLLGHRVIMFCYPFGRYNSAVKQLVKSHGFTAARTCIPGGLNPPKDAFQWHISLFASNGSPLMALKIWWQARLWRVCGLLDWESRAKLLFDLALQKGGVYHMYGHSGDFEVKNEWDKLERVLNYISNREKTRYMTNGEVFESHHR
jgi:peptidoglycan/xylan/chitin deacetylase (PgdA/CDA1 family)